MADLDPFGNASSARSFANRKAKSDFGGIAGHAKPPSASASGALRAALQAARGRSRGWARAAHTLTLVNMSVGALVVSWAALKLSFVFMIYAVLMGLCLAGAGGIGLFAARSDAPSAKSAYISAAVAAGLMSWTFTTTVTTHVRQDCIMAETFLRLDHLETAIQDSQHGEMISGLMMRMDHLHGDIEAMTDAARDHILETEEKRKFKSEDMMYIDTKLRDLFQLTEDAYKRLETQSFQMQRNITELEQVDESTLTDEQRRQRAQQTARLRTLKYRIKALEPKKQSLHDLAERIEDHADSGSLTWEEYTNIIEVLEKNILDQDLAAELHTEKNDHATMKASITRLETNHYDHVAVGDFAARSQGRTADREKKRAIYEDHMAQALKKHDKRLSSREAYLKSLSDWMDSMPEHCEEDLEAFPINAAIGYLALVLSAFTAFVALTSTVAAAKKDY